MVEVPDVMENEDKIRFDFLDQSLGLKSCKDIAALQIGRVNGQSTITDFLAGITDAEIMDLVAIGEPPHDAVHHPRQPGTICVESNSDDLHAGSRNPGRSRVAKNNPSPSIAPVGLWWR